MLMLFMIMTKGIMARKDIRTLVRLKNAMMALKIILHTESLLWRDFKDYTFNTNDTERWFDKLQSVGCIYPLQPRDLLQPGDENKPDFSRYHQWIHHPTNKCRTIMETIQEMLDNGEIEYEDELPKRHAEAMTIFITNKNSSFAEDEAD